MQTAYDIESRLLAISDLTLLTITHNMSKDILELYDEIIFMAEGKIIEHGTFETLIAKHAAFYDFYQLKKQAFHLRGAATGLPYGGFEIL